MENPENCLKNSKSRKIELHLKFWRSYAPEAHPFVLPSMGRGFHRKSCGTQLSGVVTKHTKLKRGNAKQQIQKGRIELNSEEVLMTIWDYFPHFRQTVPQI